MLKLTTCPICASKKIAKVRRTLTRQAGGKSYKVPSVQFYECGNCGEQFFDRAASQLIDAHSPILRRRTARSA